MLSISSVDSRRDHAAESLGEIWDASKGFVELARKYAGQDITDAAAIDRFFCEFMATTHGLCIVDFINLKNWDHVEQMTIDVNTRLATLVWRDYTARGEDEEAREIRRPIFPGEYYALILCVQSVRAIAQDTLTMFLLRGFTWKEREIRQLLGKSTDEISIDKESLFERTVYRRFGDRWEVIMCHVSPLFTIALLPKGIGASRWAAHSVLFTVNVTDAQNRLARAAAELALSDDSETICDKANSARRAFEALLKVECAYRSAPVRSEYPELLIGHLIGALKEFKDQSGRERLNAITRVLNDYSHESGKQLVKASVAEAVQDAINYAAELATEIMARV